MKKLLLVFLPALLVVLTLSLAFPSPTYAIADPDTSAQVKAVYVFDFADGSTGVLIDYFLDYAILPTETATEAYLGVFVDTDGTTQLKSVAPYTFVDSGYGRGLIYIPFSAAETTTYGLDSANMTDYRIWLVGNPTLTWDDGSFPKTIATIDQWNTTGDMSTLLALRVLYYADVLELAWSLDMVESTALGNRLTTVGESYFENVIPNLRTLAPGVFSSGTAETNLEDIDYYTIFGATVSGTILAGGSPQELAEGANTVTANATGLLVFTLLNGTSGNITNGTGTIAVSPSNLVAGTNNVTITGAGNFAVVVNLINTQTRVDDTIIGTGFDLTDVAADFGMSRIMFSSLVWVVITIIVCAAVYGWGRKSQFGGLGGDSAGAGNATMLMAAVCLIGGGLLGLLDLRVLAVLGIGYSAFIGYIFFFRNSSGDIGKVVMFMAWMVMATSLIGGLLAGTNSIASTYLTEDITSSNTTIPVRSTKGFPDVGIIIIGDERIAYSSENGTAFKGSTFQQLVRGSESTEAAEHSERAIVRQKMGSMINNSLDYHIAQLSDSSGIMFFVSAGLVLWDLIKTLFVLPVGFLGTDMAILFYFWVVLGLGLLVSIIIAMAGGRRV